MNRFHVARATGNRDRASAWYGRGVALASRARLRVFWIRPWFIAILIGVSEVTCILSQIEHGDSNAAAKLLPLVYDELRKLAAEKLAREKPGQTLQATALVHEAYLRLVKGDGTDGTGPAHRNWNSRGHFFGAAAEAMRRILVEQARRKGAAKRGGQRERIELGDVPDKESDSTVDLLALDEALTEFSAIDPRAAELVKLRYFAGLTGAEAAQSLGMSPRTADRTWHYARTWLLNRLQAK